MSTGPRTEQREGQLITVARCNAGRSADDPEENDSMTDSMTARADTVDHGADNT